MGKTIRHEAITMETNLYSMYSNEYVEKLHKAIKMLEKELACRIKEREILRMAACNLAAKVAPMEAITILEVYSEHIDILEKGLPDACRKLSYDNV